MSFYMNHQTHILFFFMFISTAFISDAKIRHHRWNLAYQYKSPDCFQKLTVTINGQSPGPTIHAQQGDTIVVEVKNGLVTENSAIHWHGIRQIGTPWSDGTEGVTQCPIIPGDTFIYKFVVDRPGTYMYHAHYGMQRSAGLNGMIIVAVADGVVEPFAYDHEHSFVLNDWWHKSTYEQIAGLDSKPFVWVGEPQSLLINGRGRFNCLAPGVNGACNLTNPECAISSFTVVPGKTYRLRLASISSLSTFNFEIEGHNLTIVEADGHYVKPLNVKNVYLHSGETYSVLLKADQSSRRNYWAALNIVGRKPNTPAAVAIINYYPNHPKRSPPSSPPAGPLWNDTKLQVEQSHAIRSHPNYIHTPPKTSDRTIILLSTQNLIDGYTKWGINNVSFTLPHTPYLVAFKHKLSKSIDRLQPPDTYDYKNYDIYGVQRNKNTRSSNAAYRLKFNTTVDVVLQNANTMNVNNSETHPWHLHGHDFWVVGYGDGKFKPKVDPKRFNLVDPIMKNTVPMHPYGWTAIRFVANNPGVWVFHCHIEAHFAMGMGIVFEEGVEKVGDLPESIFGCGEAKTFKRN